MLQAALEVAELTEGAVDPTVGGSLRAAGYDRDFPLLQGREDEGSPQFAPAPGWRALHLDAESRSAAVPRGVELDVGATAKAFAADRAATAAAAASGTGVLVSLGGDIAVAGDGPAGGWPVLLADDHRASPQSGGPVVNITRGGLATSSTTVRRWRRGGLEMHHILDPRSGRPAEPWWRTVSVTAATCLEANAASTAAIVWGEAARERLLRWGLPARLVAPDGRVELIGGWPEG